MTTKKELTTFLDSFLKIADFPKDASNNGLQIESSGTNNINKIGFAVDACHELFILAAQQNIDYLIVHHGLSWGDNLKRLTGITSDRIASLLKNNISLYAAHLPLDAHEDCGHNAVLADMLNLKNKKKFAEYAGSLIGVMGNLPTPTTGKKLIAKISSLLNTKCITIQNFSEKKLKTIGIVSGGGADCISDAAKHNLDVLLTGEFEHSHYHTIIETGIPLVAAGHYKTETVGLKALMKKIQKKFDLQCEFIDIPTGM
ncbi:MAG: Nif3-like dinuclear metal center hexameric protein [Verrucomicrobiota bacterium]|nr:Nif3-like dinuclear metal center hexameric protein [Verrucomicrobiota bacterium]